MNWTQLENAFFEIAKREIGTVLAENQNHTFYAVALHDSYRELDGEIGFPMLAMSSMESLLERTGDGEDVEIKYNPADWKWHNIELETDDLGDVALELHEAANRGTQAQWRRTEKRFMASMIRVVKCIFREFKDHHKTSDDFVCYFDDEDGGLEVIRKCMPAKLLRHHFSTFFESAEQPVQPVQTASSSAASSSADTFERYREGMWQFDDKLVAMGADAVDFALGELKSERNSNTAAQVLGRIGIADNRVIEALRREVTDSTKAGYTSAEALSLLGDTDWLFGKTDEELTRGNAVVGICAPLRGAWSSQPLDYRLLERLLEKKCPACDEIAAEQMGGCREIAKIEIDEILRGMQSRHAIVRRHAVNSADARHLGSAIGKKVLPAIVERFNDEDANIRRLALLVLSYWKRAGKPYHDEARKLADDPNIDVRGTAIEYFGHR